VSELVGQDIVAGAVSPGRARRERPQASKVMRLVLEGEISRDELTDVTDMLFRFTSNSVVNVVIDLTGVTHFDYRGVRPLMRHADVFRELGGDLLLAGLSPYLFAIFRSAGADTAFDYFASVEDAVASFNRSPPAQPR
jgi:anti-anti-sigma factor